MNFEMVKECDAIYLAEFSYKVANNIITTGNRNDLKVPLLCTVTEMIPLDTVTKDLPNNKVVNTQ